MTKKMVLLTTAVFLVGLFLGPPALAQGDTVIQGTTQFLMGATSMPEATDSDLPTSGGPSILLPAAALLAGSGVLTYAILRRMR